MSSRWSTFRELYMTIDRRVLGAVRIAYGLVLLTDLARRSRVLELYYSNEGILANHYLLYAPEYRPQFTLLAAFSTPGEVTVAFLGIGLVFLLYTVGLFTRVMQVLALVCLTSLNARNLFAEDGGVSTLIALGTWTAFLPLGDRFSLDALRREARLPTLKSRVALRRKLHKPVVSFAVLALTLQIVAIYLLNAAQKSGRTWRDGDAVHYVLWQSRIATDFATWLAQHEPSWLSPLASRGTVVVELAIALLIVLPRGYKARIVAFGLSVALHTSIALIMTIGPFSYAMMALVLSMVPAGALVWLARRLPVGIRRRATRLHATAIAELGPRLERSPLPRPARRPLPWAKLREASVVVLMLALATELTRANPGVKLKLPQPDWLHAAIYYPRMTQRWLMFAPEAPREDGMTVVDAVTVKGVHVDPFTGEAPDYDVLRKGQVPHSMEVADYLFQIHFDFNKAYHRELNRYLERWHERGGRGPDDELVSYEAWWLSRESPKPGSVEGGPVERTLFTQGRFRR
jgi:hypothetical protein